MNKQMTVGDEEMQPVLTQHAMLVAWGRYAQQIGLCDRLGQVQLHQKRRTHRPQTKVIEFLVAMLAGLPHLQEISLAAHPLDKDQVVAKAWGQPAWADYSGVSRTMQELTAAETQAIMGETLALSQPFLAQESALALQTTGYLVYDADLTGRPVSSTSSTYPNAAFGYMGDTVALGYQAALVTLHSPTYGRLWLSNQMHPGDTVSSTQTQALVQVAEVRTGLRPRRRTELVESRLAEAQSTHKTAEERYWASYDKQKEAHDKAHDTALELSDWRRQLHGLESEYADCGRQATPHCKLTRARAKVTTYEQRLPRVEKALTRAEYRLHRDEQTLEQAKAEMTHLRRHYAQLQEENAANLRPIKAIFRLDGGFASRENIVWLIEMGYDLYTKARSPQVRDTLTAALTPECIRQQVGGNATLVAWSQTTVNDYFAYPVDVALAHYQTGETERRAVLIHYGDDDVTQDLQGWFQMYNGRQTIEAGIKEGKNVFQMHHLKVRSSQALALQEDFACFAANFVRFAAHWFTQLQVDPPPIGLTSVK